MYIKVKVKTGSKKEAVKKLSKDRFEISVREKAQRNEANLRVREIIARELGLSLGKVKILTGHHSPSKIFTVDAPQ